MSNGNLLMLINFSWLITFNVYGKRKQATFFPSKIQENEIIFFSLLELKTMIFCKSIKLNNLVDINISICNHVLSLQLQEGFHELLFNKM